MSYYITIPTAELAFYNDFNEEAKDAFHYKLSGKRYSELSPELKEVYIKLSSNTKNYIETEDKDLQDKLWHSYDKFSQFLCDIDKYEKVYKTSEYKA